MADSPWTGRPYSFLAGLVVLAATGATVLVPIASIEARLAWAGPMVAAPIPFAIIGFRVGSGLLDRSLDWPDPQPRLLGGTVGIAWMAVWLAGWIVARGPSSFLAILLGLVLCNLAILGATLVAMRRDPLAA